MSRYFNRTRRTLELYGGYKTRRLQEFENTTALVPLPGPMNDAGPVEFEAERIRPSRPPSIESDFLVPALWALAFGVLAFGVTVYFALVYGFVWHYSCVGAMLTMGLVFALGIGLLQKTLWLTERITHIDLDGDGEIGTPGDLTVSVRDEHDRTRRQFILDYGVGPEKMKKFCAGVIGGKSLAVNAWTGKNNLFSRSEYDRLMSELERAEMIERDGTGANAPRKLTQTGQAAFTQLAQAKI